MEASHPAKRVDCIMKNSFSSLWCFSTRTAGYNSAPCNKSDITRFHVISALVTCHTDVTIGRAIC